MKNKIVNNVRTSLLVLLTILVQVTVVQAQQERHQYGQNNNQNGQKYKNIESQRIAFITQELELTPDEAKVFWPVYNEYDAKRNELRKKYKDVNDINRKDTDKLTEKEALQIIDTQLIETQKLLDLRKEYNSKFKSVLPAVKILKLYDCEREFQKLLMNRINQNKSKPAPASDK